MCEVGCMFLVSETCIPETSPRPFCPLTKIARRVREQARRKSRQLLLKIGPIGVPKFGSAETLSYLCIVNDNTTLYIK